MNNSKVTILVSKTVSLIQTLAGIVLVFFFGICTIAYLTDTEFSADVGVFFLIFCLVFDALGIWLIVCSRKKVKLIKSFKTYVAAIANVPNGCIPDIAASLGASEDLIRANLELMIDKKFFPNAFIDQNSNCIIIPNRKAVVETNATQQAYENTPNTSGSFTAPSPAVEMLTIKCKGCGAINTIPRGQVCECEYCGSAIKGE